MYELYVYKGSSHEQWQDFSCEELYGEYESDENGIVSAEGLPAGEYRSLRVILGEGQGQNWWCIAFPPLCLDAAQREQVKSVMSEDDYALISGAEGYELRFRIVELWGELMNMLN